MHYLLILAGIALLYFGGELLVSHGSRLGTMLGLSPLVVGLTIVAFGTSMPEVATSIAAVIHGSPELALGNVIGSNIANIGLILGLVAVIYPIVLNAKFFVREGMFMLATSVAIWPVSRNGVISRLEGTILFALLLAYIVVLLRQRQSTAVEAEFAREYSDQPKRTLVAVLGVLAGSAVLVFGADLLVKGATGAARDLGVSERLIGLTVVALGTSLPELASSIVAAIKREGDIVLGNLVGSNIFNVLSVLGLSAMVKPVLVDWTVARIDLAAMLAVSVLALICMRTRYEVGRGEGVLLLTSYAGYILWACT